MQEHKQPQSFCFLNLLFFCAHHEGTNQAPKATQYPRTASTREYTSIWPVQSSRVDTVVRSCRPEYDNASKQAWRSKPKRVAESRCTSFFFFFFFSLIVVSSLSIRKGNMLFWFFPKYRWHSTLWRPQSSLYYFCVDIGVTDDQKQPSLYCHYNHMFHSCCCLLCFFVFFFSTHRHSASTSPAHPVSVRIVMLATKHL